MFNDTSQNRCGSKMGLYVVKPQYNKSFIFKIKKKVTSVK